MSKIQVHTLLLKQSLSCFLLLWGLLQMTSCTPVPRLNPSNLGYFKPDSLNASNIITTAAPQLSKIQRGDLLSIVVSSLNQQSNEILNFNNVNTLAVSNFSGGVGGGTQPLGFPVDTAGYISMPLIGRVLVLNNTLQEAEKKIRDELEKSIKDPVVNIRFMNYKYSVLGEVANIGTFNLLDDKTTILDVIAASGDLTLLAKRDSIMVIREFTGKREIGYVNLTNRSVFTSPYFYIKNGDIIYVEPRPEKTIPEIPFQTQPPPSLFWQRAPLYLSVVSFVALLANFFRN